MGNAGGGGWLCVAHMRAFLIIAAVWWVLWGFEARAGYANASPPAGWSPAPAGATERGLFRAAANESWTATRTVRTTASLNVGGRAVTMQAGMRMAANAGRYAGRFAWSNPAMFAGAILLPLAAQWLYDHYFEVDPATGLWRKRVSGACTVGPCYHYTLQGTYGGQVVYEEASTRDAACQAFIPRMSALGGSSGYNYDYTYASVATTGGGQGFGYCLYNVVQKSNGQVVTQTSVSFSRITVDPDPSTYTGTSESEMEDALAPEPVPQGVANEMPIEWPVELPSLNPTPDPEMAPQTLQVPNGSPEPVPNTNPQQYKQPITEVKPLPRPDAPWLVDLQPKDLTTENPDGVNDPNGVPKPATPASGTSTAPAPDKDLCALHPEILACAELGKPSAADPIKTRDIAVNMNPDSGWTFGSNACPAPRTVNLSGKSYSFSVQSLCDFATGIRPVLVGMAYLSAVLAFFGFARKAT